MKRAQERLDKIENDRRARQQAPSQPAEAKRGRAETAFKELANKWLARRTPVEARREGHPPSSDSDDDAKSTKSSTKTNAYDGVIDRPRGQDFMTLCSMVFKSWTLIDPGISD